MAPNELTRLLGHNLPPRARICVLSLVRALEVIRNAARVRAQLSFGRAMDICSNMDDNWWTTMVLGAEPSGD